MPEEVEVDIHTIPPELESLNHLPRFSDGRIDYTDAPIALALNIFVMWEGRLLLVKRSDKVGWLRNCWFIIGGFIDEKRSIREKTLEELREELCIAADAVISMRALTPRIEQTDKEWVVYPVLVELSRAPNIVLDWENDEYCWVRPEAVVEYDMLPSVVEQMRRLGLLE